MKLTLAEPKYLKDSIAIISELVHEARFKITPNSIELIAMDPANVAMVVYKLLSSAFVEYEVEEDVEIGINLGNLKQILRRVGSNDMLSLELTKENMLKIQLKGATTRTFSLPVIELDDKEQRIPELEFPVHVTLASGLLNDAIDDADIVGESVSFQIEPGKFIVLAEGDLNKARIEMKEGTDVKLKFDAKNPVKAKYSIEYLKKMIGGAKLSDHVSLEFNNDYPLRLEYRTVNKVQLMFILAPRVEND